MRILVTGATGFIGRALVPVLRREGHEVVVQTRSETRARPTRRRNSKRLYAASGRDGSIAAVAARRVHERRGVVPMGHVDSMDCR